MRHGTSGMYPYIQAKTRTQVLLNTRARNNKMQVKGTKLWEPSVPYNRYTLK
jgi:hypothetical protein